MNKQIALEPTARSFTHIPTGKTWRRNGKTKTWKRDTERFEIPVKHGLYAHGYITNENAAEFAVN